MQRVTKIINESEILKNGKDNPAVFGLSVVESQGNITLASKSSYRGSQYDMLSDLRKSNADAIFVWFGVCSLLFLFLFFFFFFLRQKEFSILSSRFYRKGKTRLELVHRSFCHQDRQYRFCRYTPDHCFVGAKVVQVISTLGSNSRSIPRGSRGRHCHQ